MAQQRHYALFGSTGTVGSAILAALLKEGTSCGVSTLCRRPEKLPAAIRNDARLTVFQADMDNVDAVRSVVSRGRDGVIVALNETNLATRLGHFLHITKAMEDYGCHRLLFWGGAGALRLPKDPTKHLYETPKYPKHLVEHSKNHVTVLQAAKQTQLDWTMLCPPMVYNVPPTGKVLTRKDVPTGGTAVSAEDMAHFVVELLDPEKGRGWIHHQVGISSEGLSMNNVNKEKSRM